MQFIDTVTLFASFFSDEKHYLKAKQIVGAIADRNIRSVVYSDYILDELLTLARAKKNAAVSNKIMEEMINCEVQLIKVEQKHLILAFELFKRYEKLSFTDCTTVALMLDLGIKEIYSFDNGFDSVPKIVRVEEPTI